jgi:hypothetical protein
MLSQEPSAPNFVRRMHDAMMKHEKVAVVFSARHKKKLKALRVGLEKNTGY